MSTEQYKPTLEEIKNAENLMTDEQREMSDLRGKELHRNIAAESKKARNQLKELKTLSDNQIFIKDLSDLGIKDQSMIDKIIGHGKITNMEITKDGIKIFYETTRTWKKHKEIIVEMHEVKKIDPQTNKAIGVEYHFRINFTPEKEWIRSTGGKKPSTAQYDLDTSIAGEKFADS